MRRVADPGEHPGELGDARVARDDRRRRHGPFAGTCPVRRLRDHGLLHHDLGVGERRHLREMRHTQHLVPCTECREQASDGDAGLASDPRVDFVEHERRRRVREHHARRQHRARELAAGRGPGDGAQALARVGRQQEGDAIRPVLGGLARLDLHLHCRVRHGQLPEVLLHRPGERRGRRVAGRRQCGRRVERGAFQIAALRLELARTRVVGLDLGEALARPGGVRGDFGEGVAVLPTEVAQELPAPTDVFESLRVVGDLLRREPELVLDVGDLRLCSAHARAQLGEGPPTVELRDRNTQRVERGAFEHGVRASQRLAVRGRVGEEELFGFEGNLLARVVDRRLRDLFHLEAQQVDLPGASVRVATQRGEGVIDAAGRRARGAVLRERVRCGCARVAVEGPPLGGGVEQRLVRVLTVEIDETRAELGELARGREATVDVRATAALARDHPRDHRLVARIGVDETTLHARFESAVADKSGVGASADEQLERLHDERLARTGLSGDGGEAGAEQQLEVGDDAEVDDVQLGKHPGPDLSIGKAELGLQDLVEVTRAQRDDARRPGTPRARDRVAGGQFSELATVGGEHDRTVVADGEAQRLLGVEHERTVEEHVRRHRREQQAAVTRRHDGPTRGERVCRGAGGRGDDHAVCRVGSERRAVHLDLEPHEPAGVHLLEHRLVEREPAAARRTRRLDLDLEHHALRDLVVGPRAAGRAQRRSRWARPR